MQKAKIFQWNDKFVALSDADNFPYSLQEIEQSKKFDSIVLQKLSEFTLKELQLFISEVNLPDFDDFKKVVEEILDKKGEITTKEAKEELRNKGAWITQNQASEWMRKISKEKDLTEEYYLKDKNTPIPKGQKLKINTFYIVYKEKLDPKAELLIL